MPLKHHTYLELGNEQESGFQREMFKTVCFMEEIVELVFTFIFKIYLLYFNNIVKKLVFITYKNKLVDTHQECSNFFYL